MLNPIKLVFVGYDGWGCVNVILAPPRESSGRSGIIKS